MQPIPEKHVRDNCKINDQQGYCVRKSYCIKKKAHTVYLKDQPKELSMSLKLWKKRTVRVRAETVINTKKVRMRFQNGFQKIFSSFTFLNGLPETGILILLQSLKSQAELCINVAVQNEANMKDILIFFNYVLFLIRLDNKRFYVIIRQGLQTAKF